MAEPFHIGFLLFPNLTQLDFTGPLQVLARLPGARTHLVAKALLATGQPQMHLTGWAAERLKEMTPAGHEAVIHVTLTDDHPWAEAIVVIEARPIA